MLGEVLRRTYEVESSSAGDQLVDGEPALREVFASLGGCTFDGGLYRVHLPAAAAAITKLVEEAMPSLRGRIACFGGDWLGRQFALDRMRVEDGAPMVLMLEPGTGEALEIPVPIDAFHDEELVDFGEAALALSYYRAWRASTGDGAPLAASECVGYRLPLFLGGKDDVSNLERTDLDVYWHFCGQLHQGTRGVRPGTPISGLDLER